MGAGSTTIVHAATGPDDLARALGSAGLLADGLPDLLIRIVVSGAALEGVRGTEPVAVPDRTVVLACAGGLAGLGVPHADVRPGIEIIPAASIEIVSRQLDGAAYLRI